MFTKHNGLLLPTTLVNDLQVSNAIAATFTNGIAANAATANVAAPANAPTVQTANRTMYMFACVLAGLSNAASVVAVQVRYGANVPTNAASISWCRQAIKQHNAGKQTAQAKVAGRMLAALKQLSN